jgi:hypothetical protein
MDLATDLSLIALVLVAIGCMIEICRCFRRITAAGVRAFNAQTAYWQSDDDELRKRGEGSWSDAESV